MVYNTEYEKIKSPNTVSDNLEPISEEILTHLLYDSKLDTVKAFCKKFGINAEGSKLAK